MSSLIEIINDLRSRVAELEARMDGMATKRRYTRRPIRGTGWLADLARTMGGVNVLAGHAGVSTRTIRRYFSKGIPASMESELKRLASTYGVKTP